MRRGGTACRDAPSATDATYGNDHPQSATATAFGATPLNIYLFLVGLIGWFAVGYLWKDRAIMLIHAVALAAMGAGLLSS